LGACRNGAQLQQQLCLAHVSMNKSRNSAQISTARAGAFAENAESFSAERSSAEARRLRK
jgi:hypothetical protein